MKLNLGPVVGLYPTPVTIVGTVVDGRVNWVNIAHIGLIGVDRILLSMNKSHYSNRGIRENGTLSINLADESMMTAADHVGMVSGIGYDKSGIFEAFHGTLQGAPMIKVSPLCMECELVDTYETESHDNFIVKPVNTYAEESVLGEGGRIDYGKVKPILFEMPNRQYLGVGKVLGKCWSAGKDYDKA